MATQNKSSLVRVTQMSRICACWLGDHGPENDPISSGHPAIAPAGFPARSVAGQVRAFGRRYRHYLAVVNRKCAGHEQVARQVQSRKKTILEHPRLPAEKRDCHIQDEDCEIAVEPFYVLAELF